MRFFSTRQSLPWWLLIISIAFNLGFGATYGVKSYGPATGASSDGGRGGGGTMSMVALPENLNLTPEQKTQMQQISDDLLLEISAFREEMRETRILLSQLLGMAELDEEAVTVQLDAINAIQRDAQRLVIDHLLQEKQLLQPDQLDAFNEVIQSRVCSGYGPGRGRGQGLGQGMGRGQRGGEGRGRGAGRGQGQGN